MTRIIAHAQVWNCVQFIAASITPIHKYVDELWVFDGAYEPLRKHVKVPYSTDGTEEVVKSLKLDCKLVWVPCENFWVDEVVKRNFMLSHLNDGEWWYELIDDEILTWNIQDAFRQIRNSKARYGSFRRLEFPSKYDFSVHHAQLSQDLQAHAVQRQLLAIRHYGDEALLVNRFFKYETDMKYVSNINDLRDENDIIYTKWPRIILDDLFMWHLKWLREKQRLKMALRYQGLDTQLAD